MAATFSLTSDCTPILIDYGDVGPGPSALDPITAELSVLFHPGGLSGTWPSPDDALQWGDVELYVRNCPYQDFVRTCRQWARDVSAGDREITATAYAYLLRQLKYPDTNKDLALSLLAGVKKYFDQT